MTITKTLTPIGQLLDNTFKTLTANWKKLGLISLLFFGIPQTILTITIYLVEKFSSSPGLDGEFDMLTAGITVIIIIVILYLAISILSIIGGIALVVLVSNPKLSVEESLRRGLKKFFPYLWISILVGLMVLFGFIFFIIPGILFSVWFSLVLYILVIEDKKGVQALTRSKQLVSGYWWRIFGRYIILGLIIIGVSSVLAWVPIIGSLVLITIITPLPTIYIFLIYQNLGKINRNLI